VAQQARKWIDKRGSRGRRVAAKDKDHLNPELALEGLPEVTKSEEKAKAGSRMRYWRVGDVKKTSVMASSSASACRAAARRGPSDGLVTPLEFRKLQEFQLAVSEFALQSVRATGRAALGMQSGLRPVEGVCWDGEQRGSWVDCSKPSTLVWFGDLCNPLHWWSLVVLFGRPR